MVNDGQMNRWLSSQRMARDPISHRFPIIVEAASIRHRRMCKNSSAGCSEAAAVVAVVVVAVVSAQAEKCTMQNARCAEQIPNCHSNQLLVDQHVALLAKKRSTMVKHQRKNWLQNV